MPLPLFSLAAATARAAAVAETASATGRLIGAFLAVEGDNPLDEYVPVDSTAIRAIGYSNNVIIVEFHRGGTYAYAGDKEMFELFKLAPSKGQWFNQNLK